MKVFVFSCLALSIISQPFYAIDEVITIAVGTLVKKASIESARSLSCMMAGMCYHRALMKSQCGDIPEALVFFCGAVFMQCFNCSFILIHVAKEK
jgi:hypothetical protein